VIVFITFLIGLTWLLSAMGAFTRDIDYLMLSVLPVMLFVSPVFYSHEMLSPTARFAIYANPLTGFIEIVRDIVVAGSLPRLSTTAWTVFLSITMFLAGYRYFRHHQYLIADVI
jgi:lipopolysaccharide transport system permease protein